VNRVVVITLIHDRSTRLPGKPFLPLGDKPLCRWSIETTAEAARVGGIDYRIAAWAGDECSMAMAADAGVEVLPRTERSAYGETVVDMYDQPLVEALASWDVVLLVAYIFPFLTVPDHLEWIERARTADRAYGAARRRQGAIWDEAGRTLCGHAQPSTRHGSVFYEPRGAYYIFPTAVLGKPSMYEGVTPVDLPDKPRFRLDIKTSTDLALAQAWVQSFKRSTDDGR